MNEKRAAKIRKRHKRKEADMSRIDAREARLREALTKAGGETGRGMTTLVRYFSGYHAKPRPDLMLDALAWVQALNLMALPEHRYGIAGAIKGVVDAINALPNDAPPADAIELIIPSGPPPEHPYIRSWRQAYGKIMESVDRLVPPEHDVAVNRPGHVDYLGMRWMVSRNPLYLDRIVRLVNHADDDVADQADAFLATYQNLPEVAYACLPVELRGANAIDGEQSTTGALSATDIASEMAATMGTQQVAKARAADVDELVRYLLATPLAQEHVVFVGWLPGQQWVNQGMWCEPAFIIATTDGKKPKHCPEKWHEQLVQVRQATSQELAAHQALALAKDAP